MGSLLVLLAGVSNPSSLLHLETSKSPSDPLAAPAFSAFLRHSGLNSPSLWTGYSLSQGMDALTGTPSSPGRAPYGNNCNSHCSVLLSNLVYNNTARLCTHPGCTYLAKPRHSIKVSFPHKVLWYLIKLEAPIRDYKTQRKHFFFC